LRARSPSFRPKLIPTFWALALIAAGSSRQAFAAASPTDLSKLSIEQLGEVEVTSVSKRSEPVNTAASAIFVITHEDIARSGALTVPEILRLAPNLEVAQTSANRYVVTARGMNGNPATQSFSNKLLVLIDGRTVYTPVFAGVYWDMQDVLPEDIDRIEVISGPGATLWGSNAVNGVINIITRKSDHTLGGFAQASAGDQQRSLSFRYGAKIAENLSYRIYFRDVYQADTQDLTGGSAHDHASKPQAGFRLDWSASPKDSVTVQGDIYDGYNTQVGAAAEELSGGNILARWNHVWSDGAAAQVQAYYDRAARGPEVNGVALSVDTLDVDLQSSFALGTRNSIVWGGGLRSSRYSISNTASLQFSPNHRALNLADLFVQDTVELLPTVKLTAGVKLEHDAYVHSEVLPNVRLSWTPNDYVNWWGAVSRAVRAPTPLDRDVVEVLGGIKFLVGSDTFRTEKLTAYELGGHFALSSRASLSVSTFFNDYDDLRSIEVTPLTVLPLQWGNLLQGHTYGVEAWGDYKIADWWRLSAGATYLDEKFVFKTGSSKLTGPKQAGDDPKFQASLRSSMNLGSRLTLDAAFRYVSALPEPRVSSYTELNARIGWRLTDHLLLSISGQNLLHAQHVEYPQASAIPRSASVDLQWRF
jgi:iron complex outermembrane receptor protein